MGLKVQKVLDLRRFPVKTPSMSIVLGLLETGILSYTVTTSRLRILSSHMIIIISYERRVTTSCLMAGSDKMSVANHLFHFL